MPNRRKPRAIKIIQGTHRSDRDTQHPWKPEPALPDPPAWLSDVAQQEWNRLGPKLLADGVICETDLMVFAAYCSAAGQVIDAETILLEDRNRSPKAKGLTKKTKNGNVIHNPNWTIANTARREMIKFAAMLGLSPVDRDRVSSVKKIGEDSAASYFD